MRAEIITNAQNSGAIQWFRHARQFENTQLHQLAQSDKLVMHINHLVHMLWCERDALNTWLCSQGTLYEREVRVSRAPMDEECRQLHILFQRIMPVAGGALYHCIVSTIWCLDQLTTLRESVSGQTIDTQRTVEQHSRTLRHLLGTVPRLNDSIDYPHVADGLVALYSFIQGKELVGRERALGAIGFIRGEFNPQMRQELVDRIDRQ